MRDDLKIFFLEPRTPKQKQYEVIRAYVVEGLSAKEAAERYNFSQATLFSLLRDLRRGKLDFFPPGKSGPKDRRVVPYIREQICSWRKQDMAAVEIVEKLKEQGVSLSVSSVERILREDGFGKLPRRSASERGLSHKRVVIAPVASELDLVRLKPFTAECQVAGVFFFLPYLLESGIMDTVRQLPLPESERLGKAQAFLSLLCLKLIGNERLSHVHSYDLDRGFGAFAGLNVLPKPTYMITYSCRISSRLCKELQKDMLAGFVKYAPSFFSGQTINLDFHSIPHFGEESQMEQVWCGSRNKAMKGANTFFAQDGESNSLLYANADVFRKEGAKEILRFVDYLTALKGVVNETLVFDSRLTNYQILGELDGNDKPVKFITLRRRGQRLIEKAQSAPKELWQKVRLPIPKRKHQNFLAREEEVTLSGCPNPLRQIIIKDHGRAKPTFVITNNRDLTLEEVLTVYARRWRIENKLAELVNFFNLNALSSPIMVRIYFDVLLTVIADFLYHRLAADLPRFENLTAPEIFRRFIDMPGIISYDGKTFTLKIRKRAHTPILMDLPKLQQPIHVPWLSDKPIFISWTA
jgi:transposase